MSMSNERDIYIPIPTTTTEDIEWNRKAHRRFSPLCPKCGKTMTIYDTTRDSNHLVFKHCKIMLCTIYGYTRSY